jgi:hypothetical protein
MKTFLLALILAAGALGVTYGVYRVPTGCGCDATGVCACAAACADGCPCTGCGCK